jgi:hypothetical protein
MEQGNVGWRTRWVRVQQEKCGHRQAPTPCQAAAEETTGAPRRDGPACRRFGTRSQEARRPRRLALPAQLLAVALLAVMLGTCSAALLGTGCRDRVPMLTLAEIHTHLIRNPRAWVGRIIMVRGRAMSAHCLWPAPEATSCPDPEPSSIVDPSGALPLAVDAAQPLLAGMRRLPLLGRMLPSPQPVQWGAVGTYRVRLEPAPAASCAASPCYAAVLLAAASKGDVAER